MVTDFANCWQYMDCPTEIKETCEVYLANMGDQCWLLMHIKRGCPASKKYDGCLNCPWYKEKNPK